MPFSDVYQFFQNAFNFAFFFCFMESWRAGESADCGYMIVFLMMFLSHIPIIIKMPSCVWLYLA
jgi:hypothetical protein